MTAARQKPGRKGAAEGEDAFVEAIYRGIGWVQNNQRVVIAMAVLLTLLIGGGFYYLNYQENLNERAATELQEIRMEAGTEGAEPTLMRLQDFLSRFGGTESALEARVLLGRTQLLGGSPEAAIETVRPATDASVSRPLGYAANLLLASAYEAADSSERALEVYGRLAESARFEFQRREAADSRARLLVEANRLEEAEAVYERLAAETEGDPETEAEAYDVRLGEVRAMRRAASAAGDGPAGDEPDAGTDRSPDDG